MNVALQTLPVQDHIWINFQVSKTQNAFDFAALEEAVFYQYAYGSSKDVIKQAARYAVGFQKKKPFNGDNAATTFVGLLTFLIINGFAVDLSEQDATSWFKAMGDNADAAGSKIKAIASRNTDHHSQSVEEAAKNIMDKFATSINDLNPQVS